MAKKRINIDLKKLKGSRLHVIDTSSVMRYNYVALSEGEGEVEKSSKNKWNKYQKRELSWIVDGEKVNTSSLYGLLRMFTTYGFNDHYIFCFDTPRNFRKEEDSEYKSGRQKADEDYFTQVNIVRDMLDNVGFAVHSVSGYEADDFIVESVNKNKEFFDHVIVHSNDFDMAQNVDENVIFKNVNKQYGDINMSNYEEMLECPYNSIILFKAMVGDNSDNKSGIYRFGPKSFYKFIDEEGIYGDLPNIRKNRMEYTIIKESFNLTDEQKEQALSTLRMVVPRLPKDYNEFSPKKNINKDMFEFYLSKYGMNSVIKELNK